MALEETPAEAVEPVAGAEGTAAEPTTAEPVAEPTTAEPVAEAAAEPEAPTYPGADDFGWDDWDGEGAGLPDELQAWYEKFNARSTEASERVTQEHLDAMAQREAMSSQWERMYRAVHTGDDDPRLGEYQEKAESYERAFDTFKEETNESVKAIEAEYETASNEYYDYVVSQNTEFFGALTAEIREAVTGAVEHIPLHRAVEYAKMGPEVLKEAVAIAEQGGSMDLVDRLIKAEAGNAKRAVPARKPSVASEIVTGATPTETPSAVPEKAAPTGRYARLAHAAQVAMAADRR